MDLQGCEIIPLYSCSMTSITANKNTKMCDEN